MLLVQFEDFRFGCKALPRQARSRSYSVRASARVEPHHKYCTHGLVLDMTVRVQSKGEQTRKRIMDLAQDAVLQKGFAATSIDEIEVQRLAARARRV